MHVARIHVIAMCTFLHSIYSLVYTMIVSVYFVSQMTSWVCTEILVRESASSRATVIEHFIQIALYCYRHNDLHCSLNITIALSSSIIRGLRKTWEEVDKKVGGVSRIRYICILLSIKNISCFLAQLHCCVSDSLHKTHVVSL